MRKYLMMMLTLVLSISIMAQNEPSNANKKAERQQALTEQTNQYIANFALKGDKAEQFCTLYQKYNKALMEVMKQNKTQKIANPTEEQLEVEILARFSRQRAILDVRQQYYYQFRALLLPSDIQQIYEDEKERKEQIQHNSSK